MISIGQIPPNKWGKGRWKTRPSPLALETDNYMQSILRRFRNIIYKFKGIQELSDSKDFIFYKCLKCGCELKGNKRYGKLHILCKCGHSADVYTGKNIHFKNNSKKSINLNIIDMLWISGINLFKLAHSLLYFITRGIHLLYFFSN